jgi:hypothetical protein
MFDVLNVKDWCLLVAGRSRSFASIFVAAKGIMVRYMCTSVINEMKVGQI